MNPIPTALVFALTYAESLVAVMLMNKHEFKRCPEKGERYKALPIGYKLGCWFLVVPLFAGTIVQEALFIPAVITFMALEAACVRWYRKTGLL
jgi:hypothetical protein